MKKATNVTKKVFQDEIEKLIIDNVNIDFQGAVLFLFRCLIENRKKYKDMHTIHTLIDDLDAIRVNPALFADIIPKDKISKFELDYHVNMDDLKKIQGDVLGAIPFSLHAIGMLGCAIIRYLKLHTNELNRSENILKMHNINESCHSKIVGITQTINEDMVKNYTNDNEAKSFNHTKIPVENYEGISIENPIDIKQHLDNYIMGQDAAKKALSLGVYEYIKSDVKEYAKKGTKPILLCGPSGCGKTLLAETVAMCAGIPYITIDVSGLTAEGYKGKNLLDIEKEIAQVKGTHDKIIVFLDEFDKIIMRQSEGKMFSTEIQSQILNFLSGKRSEHLGCNTAECMFILGGAFSFIRKQPEDIKNGLGFMRESEKITSTAVIEREEFLEHGMSPELLRRIGKIVQMEYLTKDMIKSILTMENGFLNQRLNFVKDIYQKEVVIPEEAIDKIINSVDYQKEGIIGEINMKLEQEIESLIWDSF